MKKLKILMVLCVTILILNPLSIIEGVESHIDRPSITILDETNITDYLWSSDGQWVAYIKSPNGQFGNGELWVAKRHPNQARLLNKHLIYTGVDCDRLEDWQGKWILFMMQKEEGTPSHYYGKNELWKIRFNGENLTQITFTYTNGIRTQWWNKAYTNRGTAAWGRFIPGTDLVYFTAHDGNGWYKAYTCKNDGTDQWNLISGSKYAFTKAMSPTGNKLVWGHATYWNNPTTLMASNVDGSDVITIKAFPKRTFPLILADGNTVIWSWNDGNIHTIDIDGTNEKMILEDSYLNYWENYHPVDGDSFLMRSNRATDGNNHIFVVSSDGTQITQLTYGPYNDEGAIYSPQGRFIMYRRLPEDFDKATSSQPYPYELVIILVEPFPWNQGHHRLHQYDYATYSRQDI
ncbi:MAG: PD40 domain-containing protein [Candidatus Heimdallarchaeota archaeon]|nr:hypothetical protein [Candidatus Heimdallarchaeota archaeon]MCG3255467.1 PD40 domain-containing protein [Candidatus Heimdallarchaeota archaeon]MCK4610541.1 PD40 domain-containing protein [Candidatus Heimdallarchaeota archaeon]